MERMASSFISKLPKGERQALLDDLNYLNISEIRSFCKGHSIPQGLQLKRDDTSFILSGRLAASAPPTQTGGL
jgi:hypothetical protein